MKPAAPHTFVIITVGELPPDILPEAAGPSILPSFSNSLGIGPALRGTALVVCDLDPMALLKLLTETVPALPKPRHLVGM